MTYYIKECAYIKEIDHPLYWYFLTFLLIVTGERASYQDYPSSFSIVESSTIYMPIGDSNALLLEPLSGQWTLVILCSSNFIPRFTDWSKPI